MQDLQHTIRRAARGRGAHMLVVEAEGITAGWLAATSALAARGGEAFTALVEVHTVAEPAGADADARARLDAFLGVRGCFDTQAVANTIFPEALARRGAALLYRDYDERAWPVLRRVAQNRRGTYFRRLTHEEGTAAGGGETRNPLDRMIGKMRRQLARPGGLRCAYELAVYDPRRDAAVGMGFPCLSHVSFKLDRGRVHLTALYRNQLYVQRLYGNLLGLGRLLRFVAAEVGLAPGVLACHATHAELGPGVGARALDALLAEVRTALGAADTPAARPGPPTASATARSNARCRTPARAAA